ncbi:MAG TPA: ATP-binding protein [Woeseiaceae bacterium]|nr:ATP-binding protein [Woeseiaceae bacterium]
MQRKFRRTVEELKNIVAFTDQVFEQENIDPSLRFMVDLCVEELFVNMITYNVETRSEVLIEMRARDKGIEVTLTDFDVERFDPRSVEPVNVNAPLEQRSPGGLGVYLVMKMADSIHYEYRDRTSRITFVALQK